MPYCKSFVSVCFRVGATLLSSAALLAVLSLSAQADTFQSVDASLSNGPMTVGQTANATYSAGAWTFYLQASNTGSQTLNGVYFVNEFAWDLNNANNTPGTELALGWNPGAPPATAEGNWSLGSSGESFSVGSVSGPGMTLNTNFLLSNTNLPLSANAFFGGQQATIPGGSYVPAESMGTFAPGQSVDFTLTCPTSPQFVPDVGAFFVAPVPEPSTFVLLLVGGIGLLGFRMPLGRRRAASEAATEVV